MNFLVFFKNLVCTWCSFLWSKFWTPYVSWPSVHRLVGWTNNWSIWWIEVCLYISVLGLCLVVILALILVIGIHFKSKICSGSYIDKILGIKVKDLFINIFPWGFPIDWLTDWFNRLRKADPFLKPPQKYHVNLGTLAGHRSVCSSSGLLPSSILFAGSWNF